MTTNRLLQFLVISGLTHAALLASWSPEGLLIPSTSNHVTTTIQATLVIPTKSVAEPPGKVVHNVNTPQEQLAAATKPSIKHPVIPLVKSAAPASTPLTTVLPTSNRIKKPKQTLTNTTTIAVHTPPKPVAKETATEIPPPVSTAVSNLQKKLDSTQWRNKVQNELIVIMRQQFRYPLAARKRGWQGTVRLRFVVTAEGDIADIEVAESSGHELLDRSALNTARKIERLPNAIKGTNGRFHAAIDIPVRYPLRG